MDVKLLKMYALSLKEEIEKLIDVEEVQHFARGITPLIEDALNDKVKEPMSFCEVPGGYFFRELSLSQFNELGEAYSLFKLEITGGDGEWGDTLDFMDAFYN